MNEDIDELMGRVLKVVRQIEPILAEHPASVHGAALAELLAEWIVQHRVEGDAAKSRLVRERMLGMHIAMVTQLIAAHDAGRNGDDGDEPL